MLPSMVLFTWKVVSTIHASTWWRLDFDDRIVQTERGTRPGDGFADVIWQLCFSRYLHKVDDILCALGVQCQLPWNLCHGFATGTGDETLPLGMVVWADDRCNPGIYGNNRSGHTPTTNCGGGSANRIAEDGHAAQHGRWQDGGNSALDHHHNSSKLKISVLGEDLVLRIVPTYVHRVVWLPMMLQWELRSNGSLQ